MFAAACLPQREHLADLVRAAARTDRFSATRLQALPAQLPRVLDVRLLDPLAGRAGPSKTHGRPSNRGSDRNAREALAAELAVAEVGVAVDVGAELGRRVVDVERAEPVEPDDAVELVDTSLSPSAVRMS